MMKKKLMALALLSLLFVLPIAHASLAENKDTLNSTATVAFTEGDLEFGEPSELNKIDLDFGVHKIPLVAVTYSAVADDYTLRILDARVTVGNWSVTAQLSKFTDVSAPAIQFNGTITMQNATGDSALSLPQVTLAGGGAAATVISAIPVTAPKVYDTVWSVNSGHVNAPKTSPIQLSLTDTDAQAITGAQSFKATITWTLMNGF